MQKIFVARGNQQLGQFWPQEVSDGLASGRFLPTDLAWKEGMPTWITLGTFPDLPAASSSQAIQEGQAPLFAGEGDRGAVSPVSDAATSHPAGVPPVSQPAWERREELGFVAAAVATIKQVLLAPGETFAAMPKEGGLFGPLIFTILFGWIGMIFALIYQGIIVAVNPEVLAAEGAAAEAAISVGVLVGLGIFAPIFVLLGLFIGAAILHVLLMLLGGTKHSFVTTLRVLAYVQGATAVLQVIPLCGGLVTSVWYFISAAIGLSKAQETQVWRVVVAMLLPLVLVCGLVVLVSVVIGMAATTGTLP